MYLTENPEKMLKILSPKYVFIKSRSTIKMGIAKNKTTQHKNYTSQKYNKKMLNTSEEHKIKFK